MSSTYVEARDGSRLRRQKDLVFRLMRDGKERTLAEIAYMTDQPEASCSARLREFRKDGHEVARRYIRRGLHGYRLLVTPEQLPLIRN